MEIIFTSITIKIIFIYYKILLLLKIIFIYKKIYFFFFFFRIKNFCLKKKGRKGDKKQLNN
jgi:phosphotransferase system  glucose/maltose/N-acetylglucosamine-specific IIC component